MGALLGLEPGLRWLAGAEVVTGTSGPEFATRPPPGAFGAMVGPSDQLVVAANP